MKKSFLRHILNIEYAVSSVVVMGLVWLMVTISGMLPEADETSFLNPIFDRIDFLNIEDVSLDAIFAMQPASFPDERIVIINVGEVAPTPDAKIAAAVIKAHNYGAKAIGIDVIFDGLHYERFGDDRAWEKEALAAALNFADNVVVVNGYDKETMKPAFSLDPVIANEVEHYGFASLEKDDDDVVRRFWPYRAIEGQRWLAFPVAVLQLYDPELVRPLLRLPEEPQIIYYSATHNQFKGQTLPIDDVIDHPEELALLYENLFKDAIVLIGFVNEGGLWYPGDTHKTPMGKKISVTQRDGSSRMGMDGPDMSGLLIHANVINMMLPNEYITPVPAWMDWLLVFLLSYISIALYRILRTKPNSRIAIGVLITSVLAIESLVVFFIPIIAFFNLDVKITYNLMATAVLLFIPANALVNKIHIVWSHWMLRRRERKQPFPPFGILAGVYGDDESFPLYVRIMHAALYHLHFVYAVECAMQPRNDGPCSCPAITDLKDWADRVSAIDAVLQAHARRDTIHAHYYRYLEGMKDQFLRDSYMKEFLFQTEFSRFNPHHYFQEWEIVMPHVKRMSGRDLKAYDSWRVVYLDDNGKLKPIRLASGTFTDTSGIQLPESSKPGVYAYQLNNTDSLVYLSPHVIYSECKLHRCKELFVFSAMVPKQKDRERIPVYYGETIACEAVIPSDALGSIELMVERPHKHALERSEIE